jgi:alpha-tubulin suppressor-like RCC1 family protein
MARHGLRARVIGVVALATTTVSPLALTSAASAAPGASAPGPAASAVNAVDDPPWTHAFSNGDNRVGQLGLGTPLGPRFSPTRVKAVELGFRQVDAGAVHSLAVAADGTVYAWGDNSEGQLGLPAGPGTAVPAQVAGLSDVIKVSGGALHSLALRSDGTVWAWGNNAFGQLGDGTPTSRHVPVQVPGLSGIRAIAAGGHHSLALGSNGSVAAWGRNGSGQLGDNTRFDRLTPTVVLTTGVIQIDAGDVHSVAVQFSSLFNFGMVWGGNDKGQIGDGTTTDNLRPKAVVGGPWDSVTAIAAGSRHTLVLSHTGAIRAWGDNSTGALGDGTDQPRLRPVTIAEFGTSRRVAITAGGPFSAAVHADGTVSAWGANNFGQLGDGTNVPRRLTPVRTRNLTGVSQISAGGSHLLAVQPVPAPRFTMSLAPSTGAINREGGMRIRVNTAAVNDSTHTLTLSVSGLPDGVAVTFDPPTLVAGGTSNMMLSSTEVAALGTATLTVTAASATPTPYPTTVTAPFTLTIGPGCTAISDTDVAIPDGGPPAVGSVVMPCEDMPDLRSSTVDVHIVHPRRGDLVLDLIDPMGRAIRLKNADPADTGSDLTARFPVRVNPALPDPPIDSVWVLRVQDVATGAVGHLDSWTLYL